MDNIDIPWWVWLSVASIILAIWRPGPQTMANIRLFLATIAFIFALLFFLSPFLLFGIVTYQSDWKAGLVVGGLWLLLIGFFGLVSSIVDGVIRLVDCFFQGPDSHR